MVLAILNVSLMAKLDMLLFLENRKPTDFIDFGYDVAVLLVILVWIVLWTCLHDRVDCALDSLEVYEWHILETNAAKHGGMRPSIQKSIKMMVCFEIVSWTAALCKSVLYDGIWNDSLKNFIIDGSELTAETLFEWTVSNNETNYWRENYGTNINITTITLCFAGILMQFSYRLTMITIRDTTLIIIVTYGSNIWRFISRITHFASLRLQDVTDEDCKDMEDHWETYTKAVDMVLDMNWTFGLLIKFLHIANQLFLVYFMNNCLQEDTSGVVLIWMVFTIVKFLFSYVQAALLHRYVSIK